MSSDGYEVQCVRYGTLRSSKAQLYHRYEIYGEPDADVEMAYFFWLLRRGVETIVVDCGFDPGAGARRGRTCLRAPLDALRELGVDPAGVATVIVTHLHYDHIGNLAAFPAATYVVPRLELDFWTSPRALHARYASVVEPSEIAFVARAAADGRVRLVEGHEEVADGVRTIGVGGHSPGQQIVVVRGAAGDVVVASDAVHFREELELRRPFAVLHDLARMYAAYDLLDELAAAGAVIVPGHDPGVESIL